MSAFATFLNDVVTHLGAFAASNHVGTNEVHVRITLADGAMFTMHGLRTTVPSVNHGFGMIEAGLPKSGKAWIVRETHVLKVEFNLIPEERQPIGLHTEIAPP